MQVASSTAKVPAGAGRIRTWYVQTSSASPLQSPLLSPANGRCLQALIQQDQRWSVALCGAHTFAVLRDWAQGVVGAAPETMSPISALTTAMSIYCI